MSYMHPDAIEYRRKRWMRPDAYRFAKPGSPEADPGLLHSWAEVARRKQAGADEAKAREAAEQDALEREILALRRELASIRLDNELRRFQRKYSPDQPRVPAGSPGGGQWTDGGAGGTELTDFSAQARRGGPPRGAMTPQQQARLDRATERAQEALNRVQQLQPDWRPTPSFTSRDAAEGIIRAKEAEAREAEARFMARSRTGEAAPFPIQNPQTTAEALRPGGQFVGSREFSSSRDVRTVSPEQFETIRLTLMGGARQIESRGDYDGVLYQRQDGSIFGLRLSAGHGLTLDILRSSDPAIRDSFRIHQR